MVAALIAAPLSLLSGQAETFSFFRYFLPQHHCFCVAEEKYRVPETGDGERLKLGRSMWNVDVFRVFPCCPYQQVGIPEVSLSLGAVRSIPARSILRVHVFCQ